MNKKSYLKSLIIYLVASLVLSPLSMSYAALPNYMQLDAPKKHQAPRIDAKDFYTLTSDTHEKPLSNLHKSETLTYKDTLTDQMEKLNKTLESKINLLSDNEQNVKVNFNINPGKGLASLEYTGALKANLDYELNTQQVNLNMKWSW